MKPYFVNWAGAAALMSAATGLQAQGVILGFDPVSQSVDLGLPVSVGVVISGLGDATSPSLGAFDIDIQFDPGRLSFGSALFGDPVLGDQLDVLGLGGNPTFAGITSPGVLNLFEVSLDVPADLNALQPGSFTLATLTFNAIGSGDSPLSFVIGPDSLSDENGDALAAEVTAGSVTVNPAAVGVPEIDAMADTGALTLLVGALGLLAERRGRA